MDRISERASLEEIARKARERRDNVLAHLEAAKLEVYRAEMRVLEFDQQQRRAELARRFAQDKLDSGERA